MMSSVGENIRDSVKETYNDYDKIKRFVDLGYFLIDYVAEGGVVTKNATYNNVIDVTEIVAAIGDDVSKFEATRFRTSVPNTTYYLDYIEEGEFNWGTSHPEQTYVTVAEVTTDANANVDTITDKRDPYGGIRFKGEVYGDGVSISEFDTRITKNTDDIAAHVAKFATTAQLGHVKVDGATTATDDSGMIRALIGSVPYGKITFPDDFISVPCDFYRDNDGKVYHNFDFDQYKGGIEIYCDATSGNDSTGDGSSSLPFATIGKCMDVAIEGPDTKYIIKCKAVHHPRNYGPMTKTVTGKTIAIVPDNSENRIIISNHQRNLTWVSVGGGVWRSTRSGVASVFDFRRKDVFGVPIPLENQFTLADCQANPYTWYTDNVDVWIHTGDGLAPNDTNYAVNVSLDIFEPTLLGGAKMYIENALVLHGRNTHDMRVYGDMSGATTTGEFCAKGCQFIGGDLRATPLNFVNAISFISVKNVYLFDCIASYGGEDGFNYHYQHVPTGNRRDCLALEYNCKAYDNGRFSTSNTSNCTTAHEGANILRFGTIGYGSRGPTLADVNGCYSICIDCHMGESLGGGSQKTSFQFNNVGAVDPGKALLINCDGGSGDTYSCSTDSGFDITLRAFRGFNFPSGFSPKIQS